MFSLFQRHSVPGSMSAAKPLSSLSDKRPSYTDLTMPGETTAAAAIVQTQSKMRSEPGHTQEMLQPFALCCTWVTVNKQLTAADHSHEK